MYYTVISSVHVCMCVSIEEGEGGVYWPLLVVSHHSVYRKPFIAQSVQSASAGKYLQQIS